MVKHDDELVEVNTLITKFLHGLSMRYSSRDIVLSLTYIIANTAMNVADGNVKEAHKTLMNEFSEDMLKVLAQNPKHDA